MRDFLIDTDTASDDAVAILMALAAPDARVLGLTIVAGNVGVEQATRNALLTAEIAGVDLPPSSSARPRRCCVRTNTRTGFTAATASAIAATRRRAARPNASTRSRRSCASPTKRPA